MCGFACNSEKNSVGYIPNQIQKSWRRPALPVAAHPYYGHAKRAGTTNAVGHAGFAVAADANVRMDPASDGPALFALPKNSKNTKSSPPDPSLKIRRGAFPRLGVQAGGAKWWALRENGHQPAQKGGDGKGYGSTTEVV